MELSVKQRFFAAGIYLALIFAVGYCLNNDLSFIFDRSNPLYIIFITSSLMLILGSFITEPFFTKPINVIARSLAILLVLIAVKDKSNFYLFLTFLYFIIGLLISSILSIIFLEIKRLEKFQKVFFNIICNLGRPEILFSVLYLLCLISYFQEKHNEFGILLAFWLILIYNRPVITLTKWFWKVFNFFSTKEDSDKYLGKIIGHESTELYKVEILNDNEAVQSELKGKLVYLDNGNNGVVGLILTDRVLLGKKWIEVLSLRNSSNELLSFNLKSLRPFAGEKTIYSKTNAVYLLDIDTLDRPIKEAIQNHMLYKNYERLIGIVWEGSTINKIKFSKLFTENLQKENNIGEGSIIQTEIANEEVLYQIIDAKTDEEDLENNDTHGFTIGTAQKLGKYITDTNELNTVKWLPEIYTPIILLNASNVEYNCHTFIGKLPNTNFGIGIKNPKELITHNTAILGILGIGKSCLTFELLQKVVLSTSTKVICLDITGQYYAELTKYINEGLTEIDYDAIEAQISVNYKVINKDIEEGGNYKIFKEKISERINQLFDDNNQRVLIINPQQFNVSYQVGDVKNKKVGPGQNDWLEVASMRDLSVAEITRLISEVSLTICKSKGMTDDARLFLVFEEAHSLVPEWNSVANDGDKSATNGTAKVILQGRKYGLGSLVITQRTANISKSILNQCNTIFAMRVFDDTGKQFLENYIGSDYSNLLPTLEERHCVAIGKALKLKQPVILQLNDMNDIVLPPVVNAEVIVEENNQQANETTL